jgi:hypothetical protein
MKNSIELVLSGSRRLEYATVIECSMWRSSGTLTFNLAKNLLQRHDVDCVLRRSNVLDAKVASAKEWWETLQPRKESTLLIHVYRDVRDAVASAMQQGKRWGHGRRELSLFLKLAIGAARRMVDQSNLLEEKRKQGFNVVYLKFETELNENENKAVAKIADTMGLSGEHNENIADELAYGRLASWADTERRGADEIGFRDATFHLHNSHLGDRRTEKYQEVLPSGLQARFRRDATINDWLRFRGYNADH